MIKRIIVTCGILMVSTSLAYADMFNDGMKVFNAEGQTEKAFKLFEKSANQGDSRSQVVMGIFNLRGYAGILMPSKSKAKEWFEKAVAAGNAEGMNNLAQIELEEGNKTRAIDL